MNLMLSHDYLWEWGELVKGRHSYSLQLLYRSYSGNKYSMYYLCNYKIRTWGKLNAKVKERKRK